MAKKKKPDARGKRDDDAALPKFGGFKPLAGLEAFKSKLDAEKKAEEEARAKAKLPPKPAPRPPPPRAPSKGAGGGGAGASNADDELSFHRMMSGVVPLDAKSGRVGKTEGASGQVAPRVKPADLRAKAQAEAEEVLEHLHHLVDDAARFEVTDDGKRVEGRRSDVAPSVLRTLRRGLLPIDARLDLHGLSAADAKERVLGFLKSERARGERCVLVIHGKGNHSADASGGVLRGEIAAWLSQGRAREHVAAFATAREEDGGEGAVYVALRR
jgi:DNA-nicking Smr family endonuclease